MEWSTSGYGKVTKFSYNVSSQQMSSFFKVKERVILYSWIRIPCLWLGNLFVGAITSSRGNASVYLASNFCCHEKILKSNLSKIVEITTSIRFQVLFIYAMSFWRIICSFLVYIGFLLFSTSDDKLVTHFSVNILCLALPTYET